MTLIDDEPKRLHVNKKNFHVNTCLEVMADNGAVNAAGGGPSPSSCEIDISGGLQHVMPALTKKTG